MAKNTMPRNIPLEAVCDLTNQQGVANYEGFKAKNSFFMNGRLCPWWRRKADDGYLTGGLSYRANDDSFSIMKDGKEVMEISRTRYSVEKCESLPSLSPCTNPYPDSDDYSWSEFRDGISLMTSKDFEGSFVFGCTMDGKDAYLITSPNGSSYVSRLFVWNDSWSCFQRIGKWDSASRYVFFCHVYKTVPPYHIIYNKKDYYFGTELEPGYYITEYSRNPGGVSTSDGELCSIAKTYKLKQSVNFLDIFNTYTPDTSKDFASDEDDAIFVIGENGIGRSFYIKQLGIHNVGKEYYGLELSNPMGINPMGGNSCIFFEKTDTEVTSTYTSVKSENFNRYKFPESGDISDGTWVSDIMRTNSVQSLRTLHPENYSKKFGEFAINYVKNQEYSIGHGYKKILQLDEEEILGYTEDSIYYEKDGVNYRLFMERCDRPQFTVLDDDCVVFNTTTYNNAYHLIFDTVFCSSDDWNNRAQWYVTEYSENWRMLNSRLNQNWQTRKKILPVSTQFSSITQRLATRTETVNGEEQLFSDPTKMNVFYIDDSYTCPEGVEYDVFFESAITSSVEEKGGALEKQGTLSASGFTVAKDSTMIFSEPGTDENQENIPVLGFSFTSFNGSVLVKVGDFAYMCLKQPMLGNTFVPLYQMSETGYSATTYIQFAINGQLFSYYPKTSQIIDSNDQFVCDTSTFVYLGYSSRCAYFYCLMDKSVYTFTGDNTMNRLYPIERLTLQLASVSELDKETKVGDTLNIPSLDFVVVNFKTGFGVLYDSQFCLVPTDKEIPSGTMTVDKNNAAVNVNGTNYSLISQDGYESVPIEFETQFYGDASGESNMVNDAVYFELTNYNGKSEGKITVQTVALVNGTVKEGAKKTISVGKSDFNKAGVARVRYQPDIQECRGFKLKVVSDFEIASMKIGCEAGALAQPKVRM